MLSRLARVTSRARRDEKGGDTVWTMLFVIPFMLVLTFLLIDVGTMFATRYAVTNVLRDAVRQVSAYGSNCDGDQCPFAPPPANTGVSFSEQAEEFLNSGPDGTCKFGPCEPYKVQITVQCGRYDVNTGVIYPNVNAENVGDWIGCEVTNVINGKKRYPYAGVTGGILQTDLALGFGGLVGPFPVQVIGRSETGDNPSID